MDYITYDYPRRMYPKISEKNRRLMKPKNYYWTMQKLRTGYIYVLNESSKIKTVKLEAANPILVRLRTNSLQRVIVNNKRIHALAYLRDKDVIIIGSEIFVLRFHKGNLPTRQCPSYLQALRKIELKKARKNQGQKRTLNNHIKDFQKMPMPQIMKSSHCLQTN